mgnify:CR=1 FL=1
MEYKIDWDFISSLEGKGAKHGYVPSDNSGVTIATGFDLKEKDENFFRSIGLSQNIIDKLISYVGISGAEAEEFIAQKPLILEDNEVSEIDLASKNFYAHSIAKDYNNRNPKVKFEDLEPYQQTIVASVGFQYGSFNRKDGSPMNFILQATSGDWDGLVKNLQNFQDQFPTRRNKEADYFIEKSKKKSLIKPDSKITLLDNELKREALTMGGSDFDLITNQYVDDKVKKDITTPKEKSFLSEVHNKIKDFKYNIKEKEKFKTNTLKDEKNNLEVTLDVPKQITPTKHFVKPDENKTFFSDTTDKRYRGNNKLAYSKPYQLGEIFESNLNDMKEYGLFTSSYNGLVDDWEKVVEEVSHVFGVEIPHFEDYIPEVDDQYLISPSDPTGIGFAFNGKDVAAKAPYKEKIAYLDKVIAQLIKDNPDKASDFKGYEHYFALRSAEAKQSQEDIAIAAMYADSGWDKWGGSLSGVGWGALHDPVVLASLPVSMLVGWEGSIAVATMRVMALEAIIGSVSETLIQTQVVPYKQKLGLDYDWGDASKIIGTVGLTSSVFGGAITAGGKGSVAAYKAIEKTLAKTNPNIAAKILGKELNRLVDEGADPKLLLEYLEGRIALLNPTELVQLSKSLPETIIVNPKYSQAIKDLENNILNEAESPIENTVAGKNEHNERHNKSIETILRNEEVSIPDQPINKLDIDPDRPIVNHVKLDPDQIEVDAKTFQFKTGGDSKGVLEKLQGVEKWDHNAAGTVMVFENANGKYFIADGHQRLGLAKRIKEKDPSQDVYLMTTIRREVDGHTPESTMVEAMLINVIADTAKAPDVARILLKMGEAGTAALLEGRVKPSQALWSNATGLYRLGDEGFEFWLQGNVKDNIAAQVGHIIDDPQASINILKILEKAKPADIVEARMMIRQALSAGLYETKQVDLFGTSVMKNTLFVERTKVYKAALNNLKKEKGIFKALVENDTKIKKSGRNKLDTKYNQKEVELNEIAIQKLEKLANRKGQLSDDLTASAKLWRDGSKREAVESFKEAIISSIKRGDHKGIDAVGSERNIYASQSKAPVRQKPKENIITEKLETFDNPQQSVKFIKEADDQLEELKLEVEASGKDKTLDTSTASVKTQDEFFQTTTAEPPSSVFAKANKEPSQSLGEVDSSVGSVKLISGTDHTVLQSSNNVKFLLSQAKKQRKNIENSLIQIAENFENTKVVVNLKKPKNLNDKIAQKKALHGDEFDASLIGDIARGRINVSSLDDLYALDIYLKNNFQIIKKTDYFATPKEDTGYRGIHYQLVTEDGLGFELQIHHKELIDVIDKLRKLPNASYNKYKSVSKLTPEQEADRIKIAAGEKKIIDAKFAELELQAKGLPEQQAAGGMFDEFERNQLNLTDEVLMGDKIDPDGALVPNIKTLKQVIDDVEDDGNIIDFLKDCPGIK